jgi:23S rRNA (uracil1939-C5)-methyltransferase
VSFDVQKRTLVATRLEVTSIAAGGDGLAHVVHDEERRAVFVPRSAPGDLLEANVDFTCKPARATAIRLLEPSHLRVSPPCPYVERCGGCDFMHLSLAAQQGAHRNIVEAALTRAIRSARSDATLAMPSVITHAAPRDLGYRTRARLSVGATRERASVGYRRAASHRIEEVSSCAILDPVLDACWRPIRNLFAGEHGEGEVSVAIGKQGAPVLDIRWTDELSGSFFGRLSVNVDNGTWAGAEVWLEGAREPARVGDPRAVTTGADGAPLAVPSGGFAQAHPAMNQKLGERILAVFTIAGQDVVELFAGSGNLTVVLAREAGSVLAVESDGRAVAAARENIAGRGLRARIVQADAGAFDLPQGVRAVLLDPPRSGAAHASEKIARSRVRRVAYVSCEASTLARDASTLVGGGFRLTSVETFEMFPHTSHVEILALFERDPRSGRSRS